MNYSGKEETIVQKQKNFKEIEEVITRAIKKVGARKENDLCKYIPMNQGGYMHHFTLRKMKKKQPQELSVLIERYIINADRPLVVTPKKRAPRGSRKRKDQVIFSKNQLERMLNIARLAGDKEIISILSPKKSLAGAKRELIQSIRHNKIEQELWNNYVESANANQLILAKEASLINS
ncbi:MAG: hypothetical protein HZB76_03635 [Chlamydiae bacterium]|nr:hypothetical protein [Chlamydiota bacterium]